MLVYQNYYAFLSLKIVIILAWKKSGSALFAKVPIYEFPLYKASLRIHHIDEQCEFWSAGFMRSQLSRIYTVFKKCIEFENVMYTSPLWGRIQYTQVIIPQRLGTN